MTLKTGAQLAAYNIAWGYDVGGEYAHVTANISPEVTGARSTSSTQVRSHSLIDPASSETLLVWPPGNATSRYRSRDTADHPWFARITFTNSKVDTPIERQMDIADPAALEVVEPTRFIGGT